MLDNKRNSNCDFAEELVSYLYDEISGSEKLRFEKHLRNCSACQDELSGFSMTRNAVQEWKTVEFLPLQNPVIEIPYSQKAETVSRSWFAAIRDYLTLSPAWMTASTAFAALAICAALIAVVISSFRNNNDFAEIKKDEINVVSSPTNGNQNQNSNVSNSNSNQNKPNDSKESPNISESPKSVKTEIEAIKVVAKPNVNAPQTSPVKTIQPKSKTTVKQPSKTKNQKAPSFLDEDEEQDSLTLTDLLEQIGKSEIDD
jgi:hypothetical protein